MLDDNNESRLLAGLVGQVGQAVAEGVEILAEMAGKMKGAGNNCEDLLLGRRFGAIGVQKVLPKTSSLLLQVGHAESADRLHNIWRHRFK